MNRIATPPLGSPAADLTLTKAYAPNKRITMRVPKTIYLKG